MRRGRLFQREAHVSRVRGTTLKSTFCVCTNAIIGFAAAGAMVLTPTFSMAQQLPTGGTVAAGSATISSPNSSTLNVNQSSNRAVVNWTSFSLGQGTTVNFNQPGSSSATLNRVTGSTPSSIAGTINAPGAVLLVNPNGIAITKSGVVNVGSFAASTLDIKDSDFMSGKYNFFGKGASAVVTNAGRINVSDGGFVALLGGQVANDGVISARLGRVGLGSGELITLDLAGDGFLSVAVPTSSLGGIVGADGKPLVSNKGRIVADGGIVHLSAATAAGLLRDAVNVPGSIRANAVGTSNGKIIIGGGAGGKVSVAGRVRANGGKTAKGGAVSVSGAQVAVTGKIQANGTSGGAVKLTAGEKVDVSGTVSATGTFDTGGVVIVTADQVTLGDTAKLDASGATGGMLLIGGDYQGGANAAKNFSIEVIKNALTTSVAAGATLNADGTAGEGGKIVVWSDDKTTFAGAISATGAGTGKGGFAEVSGHRLLDFTGTANLTGPGGFGTLLLDPRNVVILSAADLGGAIGSGTYTPSADDSILNVTTLQNALASGNVIVTTGSTGAQAGDITVASAISWSSGNSLTLSAYRNIAVNAAITNTGGAAVTLRADSSGTGTGTVSFASTAIDVSTAGVVSIYYNPTGSNTTVNATKYTSGTQTSYTDNIAGGATLKTYMLVNTVFDLQNMKNDLSGSYALGRDIDASATASWNSGAGFVPIGTDSNQFNGSFDGLNHVIDGLTINRAMNNVGLFGYTGSGTLSNLGLTNANVVGRGQTGILAGWTYASVSNVYSTGSVSGTADVGGLIGYTNGNVTQSHSTAAVSGTTNGVGGLIGAVATNGLLVSNSYASGTVTATGTATVGGLIGVLAGTVQTSYASGAVTSATGAAGGLVGFTDVGSGISDSYAIGSVTSASSYAGGLIGAMGGGAISRTYASGKVTGTVQKGGVVGFKSGGSLSNAFWDVTINSGLIGVGSGATSGVVAKTSDQLRTQSTYPGASGWDFTNTWYMVDGQTRPFLRSEYSTTITNAHQLQLIGMDATTRAASYTLANDIKLGSALSNASDMWGSAGFVPIGTLGTEFYGSFDGQYHVIDGLAINRPTTDYVGLFGVTWTSTISRLGLTNATVVGQNFTGTMVGSFYGVATDVFATGSVSGNYQVGGLMGEAHDDTGLDTFTASVTRAYAQVAVRATGSEVGGLVGVNSTTISQAYSSGSVTSALSSYVGGLIGSDGGGVGVVSNGYWDTNTSGQASSDGGTGRTTNQLLVAMPSGFDTAYWGQVALYSYPYLKGFYSGTPQVISGTAYTNYFSTPAGSGSSGAVMVTALVNGTNVGSIATGANGSYNLLIAPNTITANSQVAAYTTGATGGLAYQQDVAAGSLVGLNVHGTYLSETSAATTLSAVSAGLATAIGSTGVSTTFANRYIYATGTSFQFDEAINQSGFLRLSTTGDLTQASGASGAFNVGTLLIGRIGSSTPTVTLTNTGNVFASLGTAQLGGGRLSLYDSVNLSVSGSTVDGGMLIQTAGNLTLTSTLTSAASGDSIVLVAGGNFINNAGSSPLSTPNGRWLVYSTNPASNSFNNLNSGNTAVWNATYAANAPSTIAAGNRYVFSYQPTVTFTSTSGSKTYGTTADLSSNVAVSGINAGISNVYLADTAATAYSGTPTVTSAGTAATASVAGGPYAIDVAQGTVTGLNGYAVSFVDAGTLTVNKASLTVTANSQNKNYGTAINFAGTEFSVTGTVYGSDTISSVTLTSAGAGATANAAGIPYSIVAGNAQGTGASNYAITYVNGSMMVFPKALTVTATNTSKQYGTTLSSSGTTGFTTSGLVNGDTVDSVAFSSAGLAATASVNVYQLNTSAASGSGLSNYSITYNPGTLNVTRAPLTVTATDQSKAYGTAYNVGSTAFTTSGTLYNGDTVTGATLTSGAAAATAAAGFQTLYVSNATGTGVSNYDITYVNGRLMVDPAPLTITANDRSKTYGVNLGLGTTGYTLTSGTLFNSDTLTGVTLSSAGASAGATVAGGPYAINASNAQGSGLYNYAITYVNGALTVDKANLTVTATDASKSYNGLAYSGGNGVSYSGFVNGETASALGGTLAYGGTAQGAVNAGSYTLTASGQTSSNYNISYVAGALTVAKANLTVTANSQNKNYGTAITFAGTEFATSGTLYGADSIDSVTLTSAGAGATANAAGIPYTIVAGNAQGTGAGNYAISYVNGSMMVYPKALTVTATNTSKQYGTTLPSSGTSGFTTSGLVNGDSVDSVTFSSAGLAATASVNVYQLNTGTASGTGLSNYSITYNPGTLTVTQAPITITPQDQTKTYGTAYNLGTTGFSITSGALFNSDTITGVTLTSGATAATAAAGWQTIYASNATGAGVSNYNITYSTTAKLTVDPAPLTITANDRSKTYGVNLGLGTTGYTLTSGTLFNSDTLTGVTLSSAGAGAGASVAGGPYAITASNAQGSGLYNYAITYVNGALTVDKANLTVTATDASKSYNGLAYSGGNGVRYSGFVNGETSSVLGGTLAYGGTAQGAVNAGSYALTASGQTSGNYNISYVAGALTVAKANLTVTANDASKTYDGLAYSGGNGVSYSGFVNGETAAVLGGTLAYGGTAQGAVNAGSYALTASGQTSGNYNISYVAGALTVAKANLTVTANDAGKTYDGLAYSGGNGVSYSGFVNGETSSVLGGTLAYGGTAQGAVNAGSYTLTASGLTSGNYNISYVAGVLNVNASSLLVVTANDANKTYGNTLTFNGTEFVAQGLQGSDTVTSVTLASAGAAASANAGAYAITASNAQGSGLSNYSISYVDGTLTVAKANLTVTANNASKTYDGLAYSGGNGVAYSGFVNGETSSVLGGTLAYGGTAQGAVNAGGYALTASGLTSSNYSINYVAGALAVNKAGLTVTASDASKTYDGLTYSGGNGVAYSGFVNGETASALGGTLSYGGTAQGARNAGNYTLTASGLTAANYDISYAAGALTVNKAAISAVASANDKVYDGTTATTGSVSGFTGVVVGDSVTVGGTAIFAFVDKNVGTGKAVNVTGVSLSGADAGNYTLSPTASTTASITPATLIVASNGTVAATKVYDGTTAAAVTGNGTLSGIIGADVVSLALTGTSYGDKNVGTAKTVGGTYALSGADAGNYQLASSAFSATADITPAMLTVGSNGTVAATKVYDGTTAAAVTGNGTLSGVIGADVVSLTLGSTNYADANVGTNKAVNGTYSLGGSSAGNYVLASTSFTGAADITPATLTISSNGTVAATKVYDGTTAAAVTGNGSLSGVIGADVVSLTLGSTNYANANVGTNKAVSGIYSLGGASAGNYQLASNAFSTTADITPATLTIASNGTVAATKVYDGTTAASVTGNGTLSGVIGADVVNLTLGSTNYADANVGTNKTVNGTYSVSGSSAGNYVLASTSFTGAADITPATLTIASNGTVAATKVYDGTTTAAVTGNGTLSGVIGADVVSLTLGSTNYADANAGTNKAVNGTYSLGGSSAGNYQLASSVFNAAADITPATLTIASNGTVAATKIYDGTTAALVTGNGTLSGIIGADVVSLTLGATNYVDANVGTNKTVNGTYSLGGSSAGNYQLASTAFTGAADITPAMLTVASNGTVAATKVYDGTTTAAVTGNGTLSGIIGADVVSLTLGATNYADANVGTNKTVNGTYGLGGTSAGNYQLASSAFSTTADITPATLTVAANGTVAATKVYDGTTAASVTGNGTLSGIIGADVVSLTLGATNYTDANVGTNKSVNGTYSLGGSSAGNYVLAATSFTGTADITARPITVTADAQSKVAGTADPLFTYQVTTGSLAGTDTLTGALTRVLGEGAGVYAILQGTLAASANYNVSYVGANLSITPAPTNPTPRTTPDDYATSQYEGSSGGSTPPVTTISYQPGGNGGIPVIGVRNTAANTAATNVNTTTTVAATGPDASQNIEPGSGPTSLFWPLSQFDSAQYSQDELPGYAPQASQAAVLAMIARAEANNRQVPKIDQLWRDNASDWGNLDTASTNAVKFTDGNGTARPPAGDNGFVFANGATDIAALLKRGPVMLGGTKAAGDASTPWLLALQVTADGKGILANDPITGQQVILAFDPATKTAGGVTGVIDPKTKQIVAIGDAVPDFGDGKVKIPPAAWSQLRTFQLASYFAVSM